MAGHVCGLVRERNFLSASIYIAKMVIEKSSLRDIVLAIYAGYVYNEFSYMTGGSESTHRECNGKRADRLGSIYLCCPGFFCAHDEGNTSNLFEGI